MFKPLSSFIVYMIIYSFNTHSKGFSDGSVFVHYATRGSLIMSSASYLSASTGHDHGRALAWILTRRPRRTTGGPDEGEHLPWAAAQQLEVAAATVVAPVVPHQGLRGPGVGAHSLMTARPVKNVWPTMSPGNFKEFTTSQS